MDEYKNIGEALLIDEYENIGEAVVPQENKNIGEAVVREENKNIERAVVPQENKILSFRLDMLDKSVEDKNLSFRLDMLDKSVEEKDLSLFSKGYKIFYEKMFDTMSYEYMECGLIISIGEINKKWRELSIIQRIKYNLIL